MYTDMESVLKIVCKYTNKKNGDAPSVQYKLRVFTLKRHYYIVLAGDKVVTSPLSSYALIL